MTDLTQYNDLDIAAGCAALLLHGPNTDDADLLASLAIAGLENGRQDTGDDPPWEKLVARIHEFHRGSRWDPHETSLVEPLAFVGGQSLFFTGGDPRSVFYLRIVLQAIFLGKGVADDSLRQRLSVLCRAVLNLSTYLVSTAGHERYAKAPPRSEQGPAVPDSSRFVELRSAIDLTGERLEGVLGVDVDVIAPLVRDLDQEGPPPRSAESGTPLFELFPVVRRDDRYVVIGPSSLAKALRNILISTLVREGQREQLAEQIWQVNLVECVRSAERMDWKLLGVKDPQPGSGSNLGQATFGFDGDKVAAVTLIGDDLADLDPSKPDGFQDLQTHAEGAEKIMRDAEAVMLGTQPRPNELVHIVLLAGCGRSTVFGMGAGDSPLDAPRLLLGSESFSTISLAGTDELELWKFASASTRLLEGTAVMPSDPLDEYAAWRENGRSFYLGDEGRPTFIIFNSSHGRALRERVADERDIHPARIGNQVTEVMRLHSDPEIPVYIRVMDLSDQRPAGPRQLVESSDTEIWVSCESGPDHWSTCFQLVDCVAYWVWQISPSLPSVPSALIETGIEVRVEVEDPSAWAGGRINDDGGPVASVEMSGVGLNVVIHPVMTARLDRPDNLAERELLDLLLAGFWTLTEAWGGEAPSDGAIREALELHAPPGPKKKINLIRNLKEVALMDGPLPPYRRLQDADAEPLLDRAGEVITEKTDLEIGAIPIGDVGAALNMIVADHFRQFSAMIATLSPIGLIEALVASHESALRHEAVSRMTFAANAASYGETKLVEDLSKDIPLNASTAIALRFTIEYVVACPPIGLRPLSRGFLDEILAVAAQIANRGLISDVVTYGLGDLELELLGSGRLGINRRGGYLGGQQSYLEARIPSQASAARESYGDAWREPDGGRPPVADRIDSAAQAEWGVSMTELALFHGELVGAATRRSMAVSTATRAELVGEVSSALEMGIPVVERMVDLLALEARGNFLSPPKPYGRPDVYPWRFNRELSYLRRPLLVRSDPGGDRDADEILWGPRHVDASGRQLLSLVMGERLKARSAVMKNLMSELRQEETAGFVTEVARRCEDAGMVVRTNVEKVSGHKILKPDGNSAGDLDLVAADPARKVLHVRECKGRSGKDARRDPQRAGAHVCRRREEALGDRQTPGPDCLGREKPQRGPAVAWPSRKCRRMARGRRLRGRRGAAEPLCLRMPASGNPVHSTGPGAGSRRVRLSAPKRRPADPLPRLPRPRLGLRLAAALRCLLPRDSGPLRRKLPLCRNS